MTDTTTDRILPVEVSNHTTATLANAIQEALNTASGIGVFSVSYDSRKLKLSITAESQSELNIFTDNELKGINDWSGPAFNSNDLMSANEILGNYTSQSQTARTFKSGIVDLKRFHNVCMSSAKRPLFKALGPRGESNIIKSIQLQQALALQYLIILLLIAIGLMYANYY